MTQQEKIGHNIIIVTLCMMLGLMPFIFLYEIYDYTLLPKRFVLYAGLGITTFGWAIKTNWGENLHLVEPSFFRPLVLFSIWVMVQLFNTTHFLDSLTEVLYLLELLTLFFIVANNVSHRDLLPIVCTTTLVGGVIGLMGILQYHNIAFITIPSNGHPSATFGYRNFAAVYLIATLPLATFFFLTTKNRAHQILAWVAIITMSLHLIYTRTRASWVGLGISCLLVAMIIITQKNLRATFYATLKTSLTRQHKILSLCGILCVALLAPLSPNFTDTGLQRFDDKKSNLATTVTSIFSGTGDRGRVQMWQNTLSMIVDHPLLGVGPGGWKRIYPAYDNGAMVRRDTAPIRPHNDYLWLTSEYGLVGLGLVAWFFIFIFRALYQQSHPPPQDRALIGALFAVSLLAVFGDACFSFPKEQPAPMTYVFCISGFIVAFAQCKPKPITHRLSQLLLVILLFISVSASVLIWRQIQFDTHYLNALKAEKNNDWKTTKDEVEAGLSYGAFRTHAYVIQGRANEHQVHYDLAETAYGKALKHAPYSWQAHNGLGIIYKQQKRYDLALEQYQKALSYFPGENNTGAAPIYTNLGALYNSQGNRDGAEAIYKRLLSIWPEDPGTNNNLGNLYKARGQLDSAEVAYQRALKGDSTLVQAHFNLADLYAKKGHLSNAMSHAQAAAKLQPDNARIQWNLGRILESNKQIQGALDAYQRAIDIDTTFAQPYFNLGNLLFGLKNYAEAQVAYQHFVTYWTGDASFLQYATEQLKLSEAYHRRQEAYNKKKAENP